MLDTSSSDIVRYSVDVKSLPTIEVLTLNKNRSCWSNRFEDFKITVYLKTTFNKTTQMTRLVLVLRGEVKILVESIDETVYFTQQLSNV